MSMNYVGSISILDRGDGPAQAIIDKNKRSVAQRLADETKDELEKVMHRVEDIYVSYEQSTQDMFLTHGANVEYIEDIKELEEILTDELKKKKYEQKVTVFIVGFENMSNQRLRLIQQVNEFFMDATKPAEEEPLFSPSPDINIEEIGHSIEETLDSADRLTDRLGELNSQMVDWLTNFAINKASTKGKKKMEKALDKAKDDLSGLSEKLLKLQSEMEVKEEKVQQLLKQLEIKTSDTQKYRTAAEAAKKSIQEFEETTLRNKEAMQKKDKEIRELNSKLSMLELEVGQSDYVSKMSSERNQEKNGELKPEDLKKKLAELQDLVDNSKASFFEAQRDWQKLHDQQVTALSNAHKEEMAELKAGFEEELKKYKGTSAESKVVTEPDSQEDDASQQGPSTTKTVRESRPSTKSSKQSAVPPPKQKSPVKPPTTINKSPGKVKETAESSIQDEGGDHSSAHVETRQSKRNKSSLDPVPETDANVQFDNKFELADESSWGSVPKDQIPGRFAQYRQLSQQRISELEEQLTLTLAKTQRKVNTLKSQFQEHKSKWEAERNVLIEQVEQAQKLQTEAEKEADDAMTQLEEFINEQEKLEEEEEGKRTVITRKISQPLPKVVTPPPKQVSPPPQVVTEGTEQELSNLMQQTDDAKAEARITSGAMSAPPAVEPEESPQPKKEEIRKLSGVRSPLGSPRPQDSGTHPHKTHSQHKYALPIQEISEASSHESGRSRHGSVHTPESGHKDAWLTPRVTPAQGRVILSTTPREGVMRDLPPSQESAVDNVKTMLEEENLSSMQQRTLESVRSALQKISDDPVLTDVQLERTLTIISLASQLTEESLQLGVLPDTMFEQFADINSRAMSDLGISEDDFRVSETPNPPMELLRPLTRDSLNTRDEPSSMMTFLQELSYTSLHPLPPLHGYLGSSQSQRLHPHRSGLSTRGSQKGIRRDMTFATMATGGSSIRDTFTASSKDSMRFILGGGKATDSMIARHGGADTELDILMMDSEVSLRRGMCDAQTQTDPEFGTELTEDELRMTSAQSRASLRYQFKNRLEESRNAAEERRSKSPVISVPSQRSIDDQLIEDDDFPIPDDIKEEVEMEDRGTSPPPDLRRQSTAMSRKLVDHPVVGEYLKAYEGVLSFKENLSRIMQDREFLQASELLQELDSVTFDMNSKVQPQLESMTKNIYYTLEEIMSVLGSMLYIEREPLVSSLNGMLVSRDQTRNTLQNRERSADSGRGQTATRGSNQSFSTRVPQSASSENLAFKELQQNYEKLQQQLNEESRKHEEQMRHNTVVMMEMQDTINELQRELTALGKASSRSRPPSEGVGQQQTPESAIMFTRLDSERNAKIMKRAVNDERLDTNKYKDAVTTMDEYVSLPAKRLGHLVRKYVHHSRMKDIEENVKKSKSLDENVFEILDKMEALQNKRAKRWADKMDDMGSERMRLANLLMETLDSIEQESGIFLIKPMYSYRGSPLDADYTQLLEEIKERYAGKLTRPTRPHHRTVSPSREMSSFAPAPTPASNIRGITRQLHQNLDPPQQPLFRREIPRPLEGDETGLMGSSALNYNTAVQRQTWNMSTSLVRGDPSDPMNSMNTPRILELDINRMLIGQNTISTKYGSPGLTDDRLINASQNNLRSYVTVNRPTNTNRPRSFTGSKDVPTTTPVSQAVTNSAGNKRVRLSDSEMSTRRSMSNTPPLPPISGQDVTEQGPFKEPPRSPPGSSLRGSPTPQPHVREMISPLK
ncbi:golgin subfamily A member 4-like isoform X7 [Crassostrea angulata]|uniref:golgin subfamily A member 4-like isoform X7 n=1 Tax=Magallana angulata TaxID=2784310 RepID=UPI0022B1D4F8|nr:golgin subfamily A member 4-like isoform X7 [Crassostrea angulata]